MKVKEIEALIARIDRIDPYIRDAFPSAFAVICEAAAALAAQAQQKVIDDSLLREWEKRATKAEAALAPALECVKAADAWAYGGEPDTVLEGRYDNVRAKHREVIDAAIRASAKEPKA